MMHHKRFMNDKYFKNPRTMVFEFRTKPKGIESKRKADILKNLSNIILTNCYFGKTYQQKKMNIPVQVLIRIIIESNVNLLRLILTNK